MNVRTPERARSSAQSMDPTGKCSEVQRARALPEKLTEDLQKWRVSATHFCGFQGCLASRVANTGMVGPEVAETGR